MAVNYAKYLDSTNLHYISNTGHDENGRYHGGRAGDQGGEYTLRAWYNRPWTVVLRWPNLDVAIQVAKMAIKAALNDKIGYDQYERTSFWKELEKANYNPSAIKTPCEGDCTATTTALWKAAGYLDDIASLKALPIDTYSGNMRSRFVAAGFKALTGNQYIARPDYLLPGDVLLYEGHHACINVSYGKYVDKVPDTPTTTLKLGDRILKNGMTGADVKELQSDLIKLGYDCGKWGVDGDFGDATEMAVRRFQTQSDLIVDGQVGPKTVAALNEQLAELRTPVDKPQYVDIVGGNCYIRSDPSRDAGIRGIAHEGAKLMYGGEKSSDGWLAVVYKDKLGWVSGKYGRLVE